MDRLLDEFSRLAAQKSKKAVEVLRVKEEVEAKIQRAVTEEEIQTLSEELLRLIKIYEQLVADKLAVFGEVIG